jgi:hypothetical protein
MHERNSLEWPVTPQATLLSCAHVPRIALAHAAQELSSAKAFFPFIDRENSR